MSTWVTSKHVEIALTYTYFPDQRALKPSTSKETGQNVYTPVRNRLR